MLNRRDAPSPAEPEVAVWFVHLDGDAGSAAALSSLLDDEERGRAARFLFAADADAFIAAHALLRMALSSCTGLAPTALRFVRTEFGKPELQSEPSIQFSVSHARAAVACAVSTSGQVGVDIETLRQPALDDVGTILHEDECQALAAVESARRHETFFDLWTLKEAFVKALSEGLSRPFASFAVTVDPPRLLPVGSAAAESERCHFILQRPTADHVLSACVRLATPDTRAPLWTLHRVPASGIGDPEYFRAGRASDRLSGA